MNWSVAFEPLLVVATGSAAVLVPLALLALLSASWCRQRGAPFRDWPRSARSGWHWLNPVMLDEEREPAAERGRRSSSTAARARRSATATAQTTDAAVEGPEGHGWRAFRQFEVRVVEAGRAEASRGPHRNPAVCGTLDGVHAATCRRRVSAAP
jgi:hypothetical protein